MIQAVENLYKRWRQELQGHIGLAMADQSDEKNKTAYELMRLKLALDSMCRMREAIDKEKQALIESEREAKKGI